MIEAYAFLAVFTMQILTMSVLGPGWFIRYVRAKAEDFPADRVAQLYPGVDYKKVLARYLTRYRVLNLGVAALGLLLMAWLFSYLQRPDWDDGPVETLAMVYFMMQALPMGLVALLGARHSKMLRHLLLESKRKAMLRRRGLFDFVSPFMVFLAALSYFLFAAFVIYIKQHPFPGFAGYINIVGVTLVYALNAFAVYWQLYGRKSHGLESHADRVHMIGLTVRAMVYSCILCVVFLSLNFTLALLNQERWEPFAASVFFVTGSLLCFMSLIAPPRRPEATC